MKKVKKMIPKKLRKGIWLSGVGTHFGSCCQYLVVGGDFLDDLEALKRG